jgi:DNA-binding response OmpR family regulator
MSGLLVVEDDGKIGRMLQAALRKNGYEVSWQRTGASATAAAERRAFDLVLLDLSLPDGDGVDVCRELKIRRPSCVVVMLTARRDEMDVIVGLESGADDYLTKPFRMAELLARVRAHLRRVTPAESGMERMKVADLAVDVSARRCVVAGREVTLRPKEFDLLARLMASTNKAVTREQLIADVWDANWFGSPSGPEHRCPRSTAGCVARSKTSGRGSSRNVGSLRSTPWPTSQSATSGLRGSSGPCR